MKKFLSDKAVHTASLFLVIGIWYATAITINNPHLVPTPSRTLKEIYTIIASDNFSYITGLSLLRGVTSLFVSALAGLIFGFLSGINPMINRLVQPVINIIRSTPVISVILLALIWLNPSEVPVFTGLLIMFPIIYSSISLGVSQTDKNLLEVAQTFKLGRIRTFKHIYMPSTLPFLFQSLSTAFGIGWKAIIASEVLSQPSIAMGTEMQNAQMILNVPGVAAWTVIALTLSFLFDVAIRRLEKISVKWSNK